MIHIGLHKKGTVASSAQKDNKNKYTYEDYLHTPEGERYQLVEGFLIKEPSPTAYHQGISGRLQFELMGYVNKNKLGRVLDAPCDVRFDNKTVLQPDIMFISKERENIITKENIKGAPDLTIEIVSPSSAYMDLVKKKRIYAKFGVKEYWIFYPEDKTAEIYILKKNFFNLHKTFTEKDILTSPQLKDLKIDLEKIFM